MPKILFLFLFQLIILLFEVNPVLPQTAPDIPHIDNLTIVKPQPQESDPAVIWYDDFNGPEKKYTRNPLVIYQRVNRLAGQENQ